MLNHLVTKIYKIKSIEVHFFLLFIFRPFNPMEIVFNGLVKWHQMARVSAYLHCTSKNWYARELKHCSVSDRISVRVCMRHMHGNNNNNNAKVMLKRPKWCSWSKAFSVYNTHPTTYSIHLTFIKSPFWLCAEHIAWHGVLYRRNEAHLSQRYSSPFFCVWICLCVCMC